MTSDMMVQHFFNALTGRRAGQPFTALSPSAIRWFTASQVVHNPAHGDIFYDQHLFRLSCHHCDASAVDTGGASPIPPPPSGLPAL